MKVLAGEIVDASVMSAAALREFLAQQVARAKAEDVLFSLQVKTTMMKVSDPIIFGHTVEAYFPRLFSEYGKALGSVASKLGCTREALRRWVREDERNRGTRAGLSTVERERLKELERENRQLKRANEILRKASAFFAQAELDRPAK